MSEFELDGTTLVKYNGPGGDVVLPSGLTEIGDCAFQGCAGLTSLVVPDSVTRIDDSAFEGCENLLSLVIPDSVTWIGSYAFRNCGKLTVHAAPGSYAHYVAGVLNVPLSDQQPATSKPQSTPAVPDMSAAIEAVKGLKELLDLGAISQEEFDTKKKQLLEL